MSHGKVRGHSRWLLLIVLFVLSACQKSGTAPATTGSAAKAPVDSTIAAPAPYDSHPSHDVHTPPGVPPPGVPPPGSPYGPSDLPRQRAVEFRAIGQTNDWILEIDQEWIMFVHNFGQERVMARVPEPDPGPGPGGFTFRANSNEGRTIEVIWEGRICSDVTTGQPNQNSVIVILDGTEYRGCGIRRTSTSEPKNR